MQRSPLDAPPLPVAMNEIPSSPTVELVAGSSTAPCKSPSTSSWPLTNCFEVWMPDIARNMQGVEGARAEIFLLKPVRVDAALAPVFELDFKDPSAVNY